MSKKVVFLHLPRTGGTFLSEYKDKCFIYAGHMTAQYLYDQWLKKNNIDKDNVHIIGFIRNPWDWYVSRYFYFHRSGAVEQGLSKYNDAGLRSKKFIEKFPSFEDHIIWANNNSLPRFWLTDMYNYIYYNDELLVDEILKFEGFVDNIYNLYEKLDIKMEKNIYNFNSNRNKSDHEHYSRYYNSKLKDIVYNKDKTIIERHGYEFQTK